MPNTVYCNVADHRLLNDGNVCEDVTKVGLPTFSFPTTTVSAAGMAVDVDIPNTAHIDAWEFSVTHNNGVGCTALGEPGKHVIELRTARQRYNVPRGELGHEGAKFRLTGILKEIAEGDIETGSPYGSTVKYSGLRFEKELNGELVTVIDATAGIIRVNGRDYTGDVENLLR